MSTDKFVVDSSNYCRLCPALATDDQDELFLGPNRLVSTLGEKSSPSSVFRLPKLRLDDNIAFNTIEFNAHVLLLWCPKAVIREYQISL
jgi:hypothetical protein